MPEFTLAPGEGSAGKCSPAGEPAGIPERQILPGLSALPEGRRTDVRSFMCVPLVSKGKDIGVLMLNHPSERVRTGTASDDAVPFASYLAIASENAGMFGLVKISGREGLPYAALQPRVVPRELAIELERANRYRSSMAVIMLDLDASRRSTTGTSTRRGTGCWRWWRRNWGPTCGKTDIAARYWGDESRDSSGDRSSLRGGDRRAYRRGDLERPAGHRGGERHLLHREASVRLLRPRPPGRERF